MADKRRDNDIVSPGDGGVRWLWGGGRDVTIGSAPQATKGAMREGSADRVENSTVGAGSSTGSRRAERRRARQTRSDEAPESTGWRGFLVTVVVTAALVFHALPHAAQSIAGLSPNAVRGLLAAIGGVLPQIGDFDAARWLVPAASAWLWQPFVAGLGAGLLRLIALNTAKRDPLSAIWIAAAALAIDAATWVFVGLRLWGEAYSAAEGEALITLLKVEAGALLVLFFLLAPTGKKRLGQTDADFQGDN